MTLWGGEFMQQTWLFTDLTHQYSHSLRSHRFPGRTDHSADQLHWVYNDTDLPPCHTLHWGSPEGHTDRLDTDVREERHQLVATALKQLKKKRRIFDAHHTNLRFTYEEHHREWWRKYCRWVWSTSRPGQASASSWRNPDTCIESSHPAAALPQAHYLGNQEAQCIWGSGPAIEERNKVIHLYVCGGGTSLTCE